MNEDIEISTVPSATDFTSAKVLGVDKDGNTRLFALEDVPGDYQGIAKPADPAPPAGSTPVYWLATTAGTYTNYGGVVLAQSSIGIISRTGTTYDIAPITLNMSDYVSKSAAYKTLTATPNDNTAPNNPDFLGQIGNYTDGSGNELFYIAHSTTSPTSKWAPITNPYTLGLALTNYVQGSQMLKIITPDASHATVQVWIPDFKGQIGVDLTGGNEVYYVARSFTSPTTKWEKLYNAYSLNAVLANYALTSALSAYALTSNMLKVLATPNPNDGNAGNAPLYKGQLGVTIDGVNEVYYVCRSTTSPTTKWVKLNTDASVAADIRSQVAGNSLVNTSKIVSKFDTEKYSHSSYIEFVDQYGYVVYMCNDNLTAEGDAGQFIRLSKFHVLTPEQKTIRTVAVPGGTYGAVTLANLPLQVPNLLTIGPDTLRVFFRGSILIPNSFENGIYYRDYTISTDTFGDAFLVSCKIKGVDTEVPLNQTNAYVHYDWLRDTTNALPGDHKEAFFSSEMRRSDYTNGTIYSCLSLGSGLNQTTACVLIRSINDGATWTLLYGPDPTTQPGVTGTDYKYFWEGAVSEDATDVYIHARGAASGIAKGVWLQKIKKLAIVPTPQEIKDSANGLMRNVYPNSGQKPSVINYPDFGTILITQSDKAVLPAKSFRTGVDFVLINADYSVYTRLFSALDYDGIHTFSSVVKDDEVYLSYSTSKRRIKQVRAGVGYLQNTSEIMITKLDRRYFS